VCKDDEDFPFLLQQVAIESVGNTLRHRTQVLQQLRDELSKENAND
jgi:hypothetical protein